MIATIKNEKGWGQVALPADPWEITRWLFAHDGEDAVVIRDGVRYCGNEELLAAYRGQGKESAMFYDLGKLLHLPGD